MVKATVMYRCDKKDPTCWQSLKGCCPEGCRTSDIRHAVNFIHVEREYDGEYFLEKEASGDLVLPPEFKVANTLI